MTKLLFSGALAALMVGGGAAFAQECVVKVGRVVPITGPLLDMGRETPWLDEHNFHTKLCLPPTQGNQLSLLFTYYWQRKKIWILYTQPLRGLHPRLVMTRC